jgi:hypothetical protein
MRVGAMRASERPTRRPKVEHRNAKPEGSPPGEPQLKCSTLHVGKATK